MVQYPIILIYVLVFALFLKSTYAQSDTLALCAGGEILATINQHAIITQTCLSKDYISDGRIWKPCDSYDVSFELEGSNYLCTGTSTIKDRPTLSPKIRQWVECCPNGKCQSSTNGVRLLPGRNVTLTTNNNCPQGEFEIERDDLGNAVCRGNLIGNKTFLDCMNAGGEPIDTIDGAICRFDSGITAESDSAQFTNSNTFTCPTGWTQYKNWSKTIVTTCAYPSSGGACPASAVSTTTSHAWSNTLREQTQGCHYGQHCGPACGAEHCSSHCHPCYATITQIGCI